VLSEIRRMNVTRSLLIVHYVHSTTFATLMTSGHPEGPSCSRNFIERSSSCKTSTVFNSSFELSIALAILPTLFLDHRNIRPSTLPSHLHQRYSNQSHLRRLLQQSQRLHIVVLFFSTTMPTSNCTYLFAIPRRRYFFLPPTDSIRRIRLLTRFTRLLPWITFSTTKHRSN